MHLVMISLDEGMLTPWSAVAQRTIAYASLVESIQVIVYSSPGKQAYQLSDTVSVTPTNSITKAHFLFDARRIGRRLLQHLPGEQTVITTQDPFETALVGRFLKKQFRCGLHIQDHGNFFESIYWKKETVLNQLRWWLGWQLLKQANAIRVVSTLEEKYLALHGLKHITHVPVYVDTTPKNIAPIPHAWFRILLLSRFVPQKNILFALAALETLFQRYPDIHCILVGKWPLEKDIRQRITLHHREDRITIKPWTNTVADEYMTSDLFLLPSLYEWRGMTVIEAASYGVPVIMSQTGCAWDFLLDGINGIVVPINDATALATAIRTLYENPALRQTYIQQGKIQLQRLLSRSETLERYVTSRKNALPPQH